MSRISRRVMLAAIATLIALFLMARMRYSGKPSVRLSTENCNADLWKHVYSPERLHIIEACTAVEGRVVSLRRESDGDLHIALDPELRSVLNLVNAIHGHGHLVVEIICEHAPTKEYARSACASFASEVAVPYVGDRIRVTGAYVTDRDNGWNEIHPVTRIDTLGR